MDATLPANALTEPNYYPKVGYCCRVPFQHLSRTRLMASSATVTYTTGEDQRCDWAHSPPQLASRLVVAGVDLETVQELMGHKTVAMTAR
jgi:hypothetical protein